MRTAFSIALLVPTVALAAPPSLLNFTGSISDDSGAPVADGSYSVTFRLYSTPTGGGALWSEEQDVPTSAGVFNLPVGAVTAFDETLLNQPQLWIEIEVDNDLMSPRLRVVSVPYALQAVAAASADSLNCDGCVSALQVDPAEVQVRVAGSCGTGTAVVGIAATGDVTCAATMLLAGSGIAPTAAHADHDHDGDYLFEGTTLSCLGTDKVAGIDAATGNVVCQPDVDTDTLFIPGAGISIVGTTVAVAFAGSTCTGTDKMTGFDALGVPVCAPDTDTQLTTTQVPRTNTVLTVDNSGGRNTSITIGADGLPVISFVEGGANDDLRIFKCTSLDCSTGASIVADASPNVIDGVTSIAVGADGIPVVSYYDFTNTALKVVRCVDGSCAAATAPVVVDGAGAPDMGVFNSLAIGTDGLPIIAYHDATTGVLKAAHCANPGCTMLSVAPTTVDNNPNVGEYASVAIGVDGFPVISYRDNGNDDLKVAKCQDVACSLAATLTPVDGALESVGKHTAITVPSDGLPVIVYALENVGPEYDLKVAKCADVACATPATIGVVDGASADMGEFASITVGADGLPIVAYHNASSGALRVAHCGNSACSAGNSLTTVDYDGVTVLGEDTSITIGVDGLPIISYRDVNNTDLKVAHCGNALCLPNWSRR